jgi:hypothetical protein
MKDLTFIVPIHTYLKEYIKRCLDSVKNLDTPILVVAPQQVIDTMKLDGFDSTEYSTLNYLVNDGDTDFYSQINMGAKHCNTTYFCILEFDDTITETWVKNVNDYVNSSVNASVYLPIIEMRDVANGNIVSLANELAWSTAFANELGCIDIDCLNEFMDFQIAGGVFNTSDFLESGGLKKSLLVASVYELLLRLSYKSKKIFVIPKIGCIHTYGREGSYMVDYKNTISREHAEWLIKTAQQEMFFTQDRNKVYDK